MAAAADGWAEAPRSETIETARLRLSTLQMTDLDALLPLLADKRVMQWTSTRLPITDRRVAEKWLSDRALGRDCFNFAVRLKREQSDGPGDDDRDDEDKTGERVVGVCGSFHPPECGYIIDADQSGRGYATEAVRGFLPALFARFPELDFVVGQVDTMNAASMRVLEKCGFRHCGVRERDFESPSLGLRSTAVLRLARPGKTLEGLGAASLVVGSPQDDDGPPTPALQ